MERAGFLVLKRQSVRLRHHEDERDQRRLPQALPSPAPGQENIFEGRAVVFDGSDDYHDRINDPALGIDENTILVIRGAGPIGWPGSAEVVNMQPPDALLKKGIKSLPTLGDGRQSGTSDSPSILNASPESAAGGGLAWLRTGDRIRVDLNACTCNMLVSDEDIARRRKDGLPPVPETATVWQEIFRATVTQMDSGAVMEPALKYRQIAKKTPRAQSLTASGAGMSCALGNRYQ